MRPRLKTILKAFTILLTLAIISGCGIATYSFITLEKDMNKKLESKKFLVPTEFYSAPATFRNEQTITQETIREVFEQNNYRERTFDQRLLAGDFFLADRASCSARTQVGLLESDTFCVGWVNPDIPETQLDTEIQVVVINNENRISTTLKGTPYQQTPSAELQASLIAQYIGNEPLMQIPFTLAELPPVCSNAVMAIEDIQFLEHRGVSLKGIFRALVKNITSGRKAQGGSTITQQLVKNYFLTSERTLKRKYQEFIMSILLESRFTKDEILETYLNIIYLGQNGSFQVRGYGAAAKFYFNKSIQELNTADCALLAAIVNSPGLYNPFRKPENALKRKKLVLDKLKEFSFLSDSEYTDALNHPLPVAQKRMPIETAPYYLDAVRKQLTNSGVDPEGLKIYTGLDLQAQASAQVSLNNHLENLEKNNKHIRTLKEKKQTLEGAVLVADNETGLIKAAVGGRDFRKSQFNRGVDSHRQIGSIMKPFVYLTALMNTGDDGQPYTPITLIPDEKFNYKYEGQNWSPTNYGKKFYGEVPLFFALSNSLNSATAALGLKVGLNNIAEVAHSLGVESKFQAVPSMTLGSFEMYPIEVVKSYMTMANLGERRNIGFVQKAINSDNQVVFEHELKTQQVVDSKTAAELVGMMKQTVLNGTARSITLNGFTKPAAGKTGTTSDNKDAWFAGFTPYLTTVVWVGYDSNTPHKLTGSSGAVPVWTQIMKGYGARYPAHDFNWPEETEIRKIDSETLEALNIPEAGRPEEIELVFDKNK